MGLDVALILKLAPMAASAVKRYRSGDLARSLDKRVQSQFENDPDLGPRATEWLIEQWSYLHNDGRATVIIAGLLDKGDVAYIEALEIRAGEMLDGLEKLELGVEETIKHIVAAVKNNFVAAQKDAKEQNQTSTSAMLSAVEPLARQDEVVELGKQLSRLEAIFATPAARVLILPSTFDEDQRRLLEELKEESESAAARLAGILNDSGVDGVASAVRGSPPWADEEPAAFWRTAGRVLVEAGRLPEGELAFVREGETAGTADAVEALMTAARMAEADDRLQDADGHLDGAREVEAEHPSVALFVAARGSTPDERLQLTDAVEARTDGQRARKETQRAWALLDLGRFDEALDAANASAEFSPHGNGRELATLATIWGARERMPVRDRDDRPLIDAARYQLSLHDRQLALGKYAKAGIAGARAALGTAILGDLRATGEAIDRVLEVDGGLQEDEARSTLLSAAVVAGDAERAKSLLPETDDTPKGKVQRATVALLAGEAQEAAAVLDEALATLEAGDLREQAVRMRLAAAGDPDVALDPAIPEGIDDGPSLVAGAQAQRAMAEGDLAAARSHVASFDDPPSLVLRAQIAEAEGKLPEAIGLQAALTRKFRSSENMLRLAGLRARAGDFSGAIRDALRLATDERKLRSARDASFELAAQAAIDGGDFEELEDIADRWAELSPERDDQLWAETFALARQNRHGDALAFVRRHALQPIAEANRHLLIAELYLHGIPDSDERLKALRDLSERFGRPMELEQAFIYGVLQTPNDQRPRDEALVARFQEAISTFEERFPESGAMTTITVDPDDDGEAIIKKLAAIQRAEDPEVIDGRQEAIDGVRQGRFPVGFLAAMVGRGTAETIVRTGAHPLGVFDAATLGQEIAAAEAALDAAAASWDETACLTVGLIGEEAEAAVVAALPGSLIGQTVRDSLTEAVRRQMGGEQVATMHVLPDGTPRIIEENPDTVRRAREAERAADATAAKLAVTADRSLGDDKLATMVTGSEMNPPAAAAVSALAVARHHGLVLYSDDRVLRAFARSFGLQAFGTVSLIDVMERRDILSRKAAKNMFEKVIDLGAWSLALEPGRYVDAARRAGFDLMRIGAGLLNDEAILRADPRITHNSLLLAALADEAPDQLEPWAAAIVASYRERLELEPMFIASLLLAAQFDPVLEDADDATRERNSKIAAALRAVDGLDPSDADLDPALGAVRRWVNAVDLKERETVLARILTQLDESIAEKLRPHLESDGEPEAEASSDGE
jgi:tetratricopeptide (TPR) repeat protein